MTAVQADMPVWTLVPVAGYPPSITINNTETATIKYTITNNSSRSRSLQMKPIHAITSSGCRDPLKGHKSCTLTLSINGALLKGDINGGPVLCQQLSDLQCYQPSQANSLAIHLTHSIPIQYYSVIPSSGANGIINPNSTQNVAAGATSTFNATPDAGYAVSQWLVDNTPVQDGGNTYQLANINTNHRVKVTFGMATLTPSVHTMYVTQIGIYPRFVNWARPLVLLPVPVEVQIYSNNCLQPLIAPCLDWLMVAIIGVQLNHQTNQQIIHGMSDLVKTVAKTLIPSCLIWEFVVQEI